jgi:hypothetical protein
MARLKMPGHLVPKTTEHDHGPPAAIEEAIESGARPIVRDSELEKLKDVIREARVIEKRIESGEALLKDLKSQDAKLIMDVIPDMMNSLGIPSITLEADGNEPAFTATSNPFYSASLSKPRKPDQPDRREEGFAYLEAIGHGDLIKQEVTFLFPAKSNKKNIWTFVKMACKLKAGDLEIPFPLVTKSVHAGSLTAWLKRQVEQEGFVPDLSKIGGFLGRKVEIKTTE